ncbi:hypothetical protein BSPWISOX_2012 [uncultured Gammaproteobacteria bacterium]|nr:hypothetical protein BSPWISOX_2012 [uncultured Gammaproteobacteria bacterium]
MNVHQKASPQKVSVAGCLGYDVLDIGTDFTNQIGCFSCWLFRL